MHVAPLLGPWAQWRVMHSHKACAAVIECCCVQLSHVCEGAVSACAIEESFG